jgi:transcription antitermination factor NusG
MKWHALYVKSRSEKKTAVALQSKNIEAYVPLVKTMRQWSDRKKMVEFPLLNGYVFVKIAMHQQELVTQTRGVVAFVKSEGRVAIIREIEIERLKQLIELGYQLESSPINRQYKEGDRIRIISGPLKNLEGFVKQTKESRFIEVLLEGIGQCITVKLPEGLLIPGH